MSRILVHKNAPDICTRAGYNSRYSLARHNSLNAVAASGAWFDYIDRRDIVAISRELNRDNTIYQGIITQATNYTVGADGFQIKAKTSDPAWNRACEAWWNQWIRSCEASGYYDGTPIDRVVFPEMLLTGEIVAPLRDNDGKIQLLESEQVTGNGYDDRDGIKLDETGRPLQFNVCPYGQYGLDLSKSEQFAPEEILYCAIKDRPSSKRGMPRLQAAFPMLFRLERVLEAEVQAWYIQSCIALAKYIENPIPTPGEDSSAVNDFTVKQFDFGLVFEGAPGDRLEGLNRTAPNKDLAGSAYTLLRFVGLPLGLPLEILLMDWTKSNYSQSKAVTQQMRENFYALGQLLDNRFLSPLYEWRIPLAMKNGELPHNEEWQKREFVGPAFPMLDPQKEIAANGMQLDRTFTTQERLLKSQGYNHEEVIEERAQELAKNADIARRISIEKGVPFDLVWMTLCGLNNQSAHLYKQEEDLNEQPPQ